MSGCTVYAFIGKCSSGYEKLF